MPDDVFKDVIRIEGDYKPFVAALNKMKTEMRNARDAFQKMWKESGFTPEDVAKFDKAFATTTTKMEKNLSNALLGPLKQFENQSKQVATSFGTAIAIALQKAGAQARREYTTLAVHMASRASPARPLSTIDERARALTGLIEHQRQLRQYATQYPTTFGQRPPILNAFADSGAYYGTRAQAGRLRAGAAGIPESRMTLWEQLRQEQLAIRQRATPGASNYWNRPTYGSETVGGAYYGTRAQAGRLRAGAAGIPESRMTLWESLAAQQREIRARANPNASSSWNRPTYGAETVGGAYAGTRAQVGRINYGAQLDNARPSFASMLQNYSIDGGHLARAARVGAGVSVMAGQYNVGGGLYALANVLQSVPALGAAASVAITGLGVAAAGAAVPIGLMASALDMNKQLADTSTLVGNVTDSFEKFAENMTKVKGIAIDMSNKFGIGVEDTLKAFKTALSAGIEVDQLEEFTDIAGTMSKALGSGLNESIDILTSFKDAYKLNMNELKEVSDVLFNTIDLGKVNVHDFQNSLGRLIPVASAAGLSFKDLSAWIITLTRTGMKPSAAITSIGAAIEAIITPSDIAKKNAQELGIELGEAAIRGKPFLDFLEDLQSKTGGSGEALGSVFRETRAFRGIAGTLQNLALYGTSRDEVGAEGTAEKAAERAMNNFSDQFAKMYERVVNIAKNAGNSMLESLTPLLNRVNEILEKSDKMGRYAKGDMEAGRELTPEERAEARVSKKFPMLSSRVWQGKYGSAVEQEEYDRALKEEKRIEADRELLKKQEAFVREQAKIAETKLQSMEGKISADIHAGEAAQKDLEKNAEDKIKAFGTPEQKKALEDINLAIKERDLNLEVEKGKKAKEYRESDSYKKYSSLLGKLARMTGTETLSSLDIDDFVGVLNTMEQSEARDDIIKKIKTGQTQGLALPFLSLMKAQERIATNVTVEDNSNVPPMLRRLTLEEQRKQILDAGAKLGAGDVSNEAEKEKRRKYYEQLSEETLRAYDAAVEKYANGVDRINEKYNKKIELFNIRYNNSARDAQQSWQLRKLGKMDQIEEAPAYAMAMLRNSFKTLSGEDDFAVFNEKLKEFKSLYSSIGSLAEGAKPEGYDNTLSYLMGKKENNRFFGGSRSSRFNADEMPTDIESMEDFEYALLGRKKKDFEANIESNKQKEMNALTVPSMEDIMARTVEKLSQREIKVTVDSATLQPIKVEIDHSYDPKNPQYIAAVVKELLPALTEGLRKSDRTGVNARSQQDTSMSSATVFTTPVR